MTWNNLSLYDLSFLFLNKRTFLRPPENQEALS